MGSLWVSNRPSATERSDFHLSLFDIIVVDYFGMGFLHYEPGCSARKNGVTCYCIFGAY